ncbi:MAG: hypothetical protein JSU09_14565 [Bacteroidetes bacterium]|nr:hypothetical protein [Bacteroidota bacterium]
MDWQSNLGNLKTPLSCLFLTFLITFSQAQNGKEIVDKYLDTVSSGDIGKWHRIKTFYSTDVGYFSTEKFKQGFGIPNKDKISYKRVFQCWPYKKKEELYSDSLFQNLTSSFYYFKNKKVIFLGNMPPMEVIGDNSIFFDFPPTIVEKFIEGSTHIKYVGIDNIANSTSTFYKVDVKTKNGDYRSLFFDTQTFLLRAIYIPEENVYWIYSNYKVIDGYLIATVMEIMNDGVVFSRTIYKTIEFNKPIEDNIFKY